MLFCWTLLGPMGFYFFQAEEIAGVKGLRVLKVETEVTAVL